MARPSAKADMPRPWRRMPSVRAVGGPKWDAVPYEVRPEAGLLRLRKDLELFANLRPAICYPALASASSLKPELVEGLDILIIPRTDGWRLFRRAEDHHRSRQWPEAPSIPRSTTPMRSSVFPPWPRNGPHPPQYRVLHGKAQRHEVRCAVEPGGNRDAQGQYIPM